ncbi:MAG: tRNA uridine-5-carboxymethylaminomethyl(34) synthesis enzyme MnmG [Bacteroidota bacterium]
MFINYDIIVVGGGHSGVEAAAAAARLGSKVLLITHNLATLALMSCNPSVGGVSKGQIVREIDALGGLMGVVTDKSMIQFRMLNRSKGPAMWSPRAQCDKYLFSQIWRQTLEAIPNLDFWQDNVSDLIIENNTIKGVYTSLGLKINSKSVILTNGTFLNGLIHIGNKSFSGGRIGESASFDLTQNLIRFGFESKRMKTGTPVRIDGRTIDYSKLIEQPGDENPSKFSFTDTAYLTKQKSCFLAYTSEMVHDILRTGFDQSPLFTGTIKGTGPRYCPSIEDKIEKFSDKNKHQLFLEPEGRDSIEYYLNGFSSSLPEDIQYKALQKIEGFKNVKIFRPGYAIEYDYFPPTQLLNTLETRLINGLYFAGQINGTTGYEEAAGQGLIAGINAHQKINNLKELVLKRHEAYIGVLIDDLINKGVDEPYRMFTSRAEYRILLRQDNADLRLTPIGYEIGLVDNNRFNDFTLHKNQTEYLLSFLKSTSVKPEELNDFLIVKNESQLIQKTKLSQLLLRPNISIFELKNILLELNSFIEENNPSNETISEAEINLKYEGYIIKEQEMAEKIIKYEEIIIHSDFDYHAIKSLSSEAREKLSKYKPSTIGQASKISGITPSDISVLIIYLRK